jgi:hypothetical protein
MAGPPNLYLSTDFAHDGVVFAQTASGIFKSTTGGKTFTPVAIGTAGAAATATAMLALAPRYAENTSRSAYASVMQVFGSGKDMKRTGGVYHSADGGATWSVIGSPSPLDDGSTAVAVAPDGRVFGAYLTDKGQGGLLCSTDGKAWRAFCPSVVAASAHQAARPSADTSCGGTSGCAAGGGAASDQGPGTGGDSRSGGLGADAGTAQPSGEMAGVHGSTGSRRWLLPLLVAVALGVAACVAAAVRRRVASRRT